MTDQDELTPVFMPPLGTVLIAIEDDTGSPLTQDQVLLIRDSATCIMMKQADADELIQSRGADIDPENCWYDWQMLRRQLGRKPDLDPGARVDYFESENSEYQATIAMAQQTMNKFTSMLTTSLAEWALIKTELPSKTDGRIFMWLNNVKRTSDGFSAQVFEVPPALDVFTVGDKIDIEVEKVLDWMINDDGMLHGGYSLRYHRDRLPDHERAAFDEHIGVRTYA